ncbi:MAG: FprA family A-type flavoprotein [Promethearchaeati archaeon SRVP18_Atabeyarchaeia-1]
MAKIQLVDGIYWVGVVDWNLRDFHGYTTSRGATYNSYLIDDEKKVLVDTVKYPFFNELIEKVGEFTEPEKLDYIIINHVEQDHSSSYPMIMNLAKNATVVATQRGKEGLIKHYGEVPNEIKVVKTGDEIKIGKRTLRFIEVPMIHWPDSMMTYVVEDEVLLSNDAFGQHYATSGRFDDEVDEHILMEELAKYFANILMPITTLIARKIDEITQMGIPLKMIAPSHGLIWRTNPSKVVRTYLDWCKGFLNKQKVVVVYDTMWGSTEKMARAIVEGIRSAGAEAKLMKLRITEMTDIVTEILDSKAVVVGSPTLHNEIFPSVSGFLTYISGLKPKGKVWSFFGSYGWGGGAVKKMTEIAAAAKFEVNESSLEVKYIPTKEELEKCVEFGKEIAGKII